MEFDFILACGDSFTEGCQDQIGKGVEGTWPGMLAERFGVPFANIASGGSSKVEKSKSTCTEIGFTPGTEEFGKCVLKMMDVE